MLSLVNILSNLLLNFCNFKRLETKSKNPKVLEKCSNSFKNSL